MNVGCLSDAPISVVNPSPSVYTPSVSYQDITVLLNVYNIFLNYVSSGANRSTWCAPLADDTTLSVSEIPTKCNGITINDRTISIKGKFTIYDASGKAITSGKDKIINLPRSGIYFIGTPEKVIKVLVR